MALKATRRNALQEIRRRFFAALSWRGLTAEWFANANGVRPQHVSAVLHGKRDSMKLLSSIVAFIIEVERQICQESARGSTEAHLAQLAA